MIKLADFQEKWSFLLSKNVLLACSGGVDSMVLLHLLLDLGIKPTVLHVNYQLRGEESDIDERFVKQFCEKFELPFFCKRFSTQNHLIEHGGNLQEVARNIRYSWFNEFLVEDTYLALAHHANDQVETFILNLARKSGIIGMSCMLEKDEEKIRPLLPYSKKDILEFAKQNRIQWREDQSNGTLKYNRNLIRHFLLPAFEKVSPNFQASVQTLLATFQENRLELELKIESVLQETNQLKQWKFTHFDSNTSEEIHLILKNQGFPARMINELKKLRKSENQKQLHFNENFITKKGDCFEFSTHENQVIKKTLDFHQEIVENLPPTFSKNEIYLDADKIKGKLSTRLWREDDRMKPIGIAGSQSILSILKNAKVDPKKRKYQFVLVDDDTILACIHYKISRLKIANKDTRCILKISFEIEK
jgi:tRNA(Ile)-lysidine synthase